MKSSTFEPSLGKKISEKNLYNVATPKGSLLFYVLLSFIIARMHNECMGLYGNLAQH